MQQWFIIKVSDLLKNPWQKDNIKLNDLYLEDLPNMNSWLSCELELESLNDEMLFVTVKNLKCSVNEICDRCLEEYNRDISILEYKSKFIYPTKNDEEFEDLWKWDEELFQINPRFETIDVQDLLYHTIKLQDQIVKKCSKCSKIKIEDDLDDIDYFESKSNIVFH